MTLIMLTVYCVFFTVGPTVTSPSQAAVSGQVASPVVRQFIKVISDVLLYLFMVSFADLSYSVFARIALLIKSLYQLI